MNQIIKLNLIPHGIPPTVYLSQNDVGRQIEIQLYSGNGKYIAPAGSFFELHARKPDGKGVINATYAATQVSNILLTVPEALCQVPGKTTCKLYIVKDKKKLGPCNFYAQIDADPTPEDADLSNSDLSLLDSYLKEIKDEASDTANYRDAAKTYKDAAATSEANAKKYADNVNIGTTDFSDIGSNLSTAVRNTYDMAKIHKETLTLSASKWTGSEPYTYDLGSAYSSRMACMMYNTDQLTETEMDRINDFCITSGIGSAVYAETKPDVDIPVIVWYREV